MDIFPKEEWYDEYQSAHVRAVDVTLIELLLKSMHGWADRDRVCSADRFMTICTGTKKWMLDFKKELNSNSPKDKGKKIEYPRIRLAADFLGLPPWFLFDINKNSDLERLFEFKSKPFGTFALLTIWDKNFDVERLFRDIPLKRSTRKEVTEELSTFLNKIRGLERNVKVDGVNYGKDYLIDSIISLLVFIKDYRNTFTFTTNLGFNGHSGSWTKGTLRIVQGELPPEPGQKKHLWQSAWLTFRVAEDTFSYYEEQIHLILNQLLDIFHVNPIKIVATQDGMTSIIFSWQSLRFKQIPDDTLHLIRQRLPNANLSINCEIMGEARTSVPALTTIQTPSTEANDPFAPLLNWLNYDIPKSRRQDVLRGVLKTETKFTRRTNSLPLLIEMGYLGHNDRLRIVFKQSHNTEDPRWFCRLVISGDTPRVRWEFNQQLYSISKLTREVLNELDLSYDDEHLNGNQYWVKEGEEKNLYTIAESHIRSMKANRESLSLFDME